MMLRIKRFVAQGQIIRFVQKLTVFEWFVTNVYTHSITL
jgi:hypothetical protein